MSRPTQSDLPLLRRVDEVVSGMIEHANSMKRASNDAGELLAVAHIIDKLESERDSVRRTMRKLQS